MMRIGSMCSGYGGLDMAVEEVFGATPAWFCEYDDAPSKILAHHWPEVPNHHDLTSTDWAGVEPVEIVTAGYPCQPWSSIGQRKGTNDERHLWPYIRDAIRVLRPRLVILENVAGHRSLGFDQVLADMAQDGLHAQWASVRASDIGAPHQRERLFILAHPSGATVGQFAGGSPTEEAGAFAGDGFVDYRGERADRVGWEAAADSAHDGRERGRAARAGRAGLEDCHSRTNWGPYAPAVRNWERVFTGPAPAPAELNSNGKPRLNAAFAEWMQGIPAGHVTAPTIGLSRSQQLKAIGNGVCPPQAAHAIRQLLAIEKRQAI